MLEKLRTITTSLDELEVLLLGFLAALLFAWGLVGLSVAINLYDERPVGTTPPWPVAIMLMWPLWPFALGMAVAPDAAGHWFSVLGLLGTAALCSVLDALLLGCGLIAWLRRG